MTWLPGLMLGVGIVVGSVLTGSLFIAALEIISARDRHHRDEVKS